MPVGEEDEDVDTLGEHVANRLGQNDIAEMGFATRFKADIGSKYVVSAVAGSACEDRSHVLDADDLIDVREHPLKLRARRGIERSERVVGSHSVASGVEQFVEFLTATEGASVVIRFQRLFDLSDHRLRLSLDISRQVGSHLDEMMSCGYGRFRL